MKRGTFLLISFCLPILFFVWLILDYIEFFIRDPSNARVINNWICIIYYGIYFGVAYSLIFIKLWGKTPLSRSVWPPIRCYGLLGWTILMILSTPVLLRGAARIHIVVCVVIDILFLIRMIIGRMRNEDGWIWQTYAVIYIWLEFLLPDIVINIIL